ncbi:MAG: UvrD-helicase domain-containing protein [Granulosicoccus sp.]
MNQPVDAAVRQLALDPQRSFIVQAPAGSGKTELLTRRILTLLCTVEEPEQILAITFTRKAASEMRQRVIEMLDLAAVGVEPEDAHEKQGFLLASNALDTDRRLGWRLLDDPGRLNIRTIDSLATQLAHRLPVTSALGAPMGVIEDAGSLFEEVAEHFIEANYSALQRVLLQLGNKLERARALLAQMLSNRDQWKRHVYAASGRRESLRFTLEAMLAELVETRLQQLCSMQPAELESLLVPRLRMAGEFLLSDVAGDAAGLGKLKQPLLSMEQLPSAQAQDLHGWQSVADALLTGKGTLRKRLTVKEGFPPEGEALARGCEKSELKLHKKLMGDVIELLAEVPQFCDLLQEVRELPEPCYTDEQWALLSELLDALPGLLTELQWGFATHRCIDFAEVAQRAQRALGTDDDPTDLALAMDLRLSHVLVDEFQDTSQTQFALFEQLIAGWSDQEARTFFAVGDPMQSIYRFREGDVTLFQQAAEAGVGPVTLEPLTLLVNFRSAPAVIDWVNSTFAAIFPPYADPSTGAIPYSPSTAFRKQDGSVHVHPLIDAQENEQAMLVTRLCLEAVKDDPEHQVAILVRSRSHAADILAALREAGLAYQSVDMDPIGDRAVVKDLVALVMALRYPHDRLHWLALLRSPFVGLSLHDLHALMDGCERHETVFSLSRNSERVSRLGADGKARLQRFTSVIEAAVARAQRTKLMPWVESSWLQLGGPVVCRDQVDLDAAERAMQLLFKLEDEGELWHKGSIERAMDRLFAAPSAGQDCQIQVMTLHKSKGLEFDTVILPSLERKPGADGTRLLDWFEGSLNGETQLLLAPFEQSGKKAQQRDGINRLVRRARERCDEEEKKRLLYVACTRARRHLHVIGTLRHKASGEIGKPLPVSLLAPLWPVVEGDFCSDAADQKRQSGVVTESQPELDLEHPGAVQPPLVERIVLPAKPIRFPVYTPVGQPEPATEAQVSSIDFFWAGRDARDIGTVVHQQLQIIAASPETPDQLNPQAMAGSIERQLKNLGVPSDKLETGLATVLRALSNTLTDSRGRWILAKHSDARSEWALSVIDDQLDLSTSQTVQNVILDRTFVDEQDTRWIIDFKTGDHSGGQIDNFLDNEQKRYADQLERYARVMRKIDHRPIRLALYFPMLKGWREWAFTEA